MKKLSLGKKLSIVTVLVVVLFLGGVFAFKLLAESKILASLENEVLAVSETDNGYDEEIMSFEDVNAMTVADFVRELGYDSRICEDFSSKYGLDSSSVTVDELSTQQYGYLSALIYIYQYSANPILARNEEKEDGQVIIGEDGEYMYSLETSLRDVNAMSGNIDTTTSIAKILEKYDVNPDGNTGDLTPEIIVEIGNMIYELSDHPKG